MAIHSNAVVVIVEEKIWLNDAAGMQTTQNSYYVLHEVVIHKVHLDI